MIALLVLSFLASASYSATEWATGKVTSIYLDPNNYGMCIVKLDAFTSSTIGCPTSWISFSCSGDFNSKYTANKFMELAQISYVSSTNMSLKIDSNKKHNGYCTATEGNLNKL